MFSALSNMLLQSGRVARARRTISTPNAIVKQSSVVLSVASCAADMVEVRVACTATPVSAAATHTRRVLSITRRRKLGP